MSTTEATGLEVGATVRFTASRLGVVADLTANHFVDEVAGEGDIGVYFGKHPNAQLAERDWHLVKVARLESTAGQNIVIYAEGNEHFVPVHRGMFEVVEDEPEIDEARVGCIRGLRALADFLEESDEAPTPTWAMAHFPSYAFKGDAAEARAAVGAMKDERASIKIDRDHLEIRREFGPVRYEVEIPAKLLCEEREVTKTEFVIPEEVLNGGGAA